jgi:hypothetical protein
VPAFCTVKGKTIRGVGGYVSLVQADNHGRISTTKNNSLRKPGKTGTLLLFLWPAFTILPIPFLIANFYSSLIFSLLPYA